MEEINLKGLRAMINAHLDTEMHKYNPMNYGFVCGLIIAQGMLNREIKSFDAVKKMIPDEPDIWEEDVFEEEPPRKPNIFKKAMTREAFKGFVDEIIGELEEIAEECAGWINISHYVKESIILLKLVRTHDTRNTINDKNFQLKYRSSWDKMTPKRFKKVVEKEIFKTNMDGVVFITKLEKIADKLEDLYRDTPYFIAELDNKWNLEYLSRACIDIRIAIEYLYISLKEENKEKESANEL